MEFGIWWSEPIPMYFDNCVAMLIGYNPMIHIFHEWTKHIEVNYHFVQGVALSGCICTPFTKSEDQLVYVFTKHVAKKWFFS